MTERPLPNSTRRNILTGGALFCALTAAGVDGALRIKNIQKITSELEPMRPKLSEPQIQAERRLVSQYDSCQEITNGKCNQIMSSETPAQIDNARAIVKQDDVYRKILEEKTTPEMDRLIWVDILDGSLSIPVIFGIRVLREALDFYRNPW